ncbi:MAG: hypothetical protein Q4D82_05675 [Neisseria sp.]|nr:hypothetical protein [Neisseria sp.]
MKKMLAVLTAVFGLAACAADKPAAVPQVQGAQPFQEQLADAVLSKAELDEKAERSRNGLLLCVSEIHPRLLAMYPEKTAAERFDMLTETCRDYVDRYNVYSILLAAGKMNKPLTEREAWQILQENYRTKGRGQTNAELYETLRRAVQRLAR